MAFNFWLLALTLYAFKPVYFILYSLFFLGYPTFMYSLESPLTSITGIGDATATLLEKKGITSLKDLLLYLPLRYEDRSTFVTIDQLSTEQLTTFEAEVKSVSNFYKNRRSIQSATVEDVTGKIKLMWFNNRWIKDRLKKGHSYLFSGKLNKYHTVTQPTVEDIKTDTIHTGRLVPIYPSLGSIKQGTLRRLLKHVIDHLVSLPTLEPTVNDSLPSLLEALKQLHFPDTDQKVIESRERLALEELLALIQHSQDIKQDWQTHHNAVPIPTDDAAKIKSQLPFHLTPAQEKTLVELMLDLESTTPMNRLLLGDVGSGKTVVAGIGCWLTLQTGHSAAFIVPTQILAEQHFQTFQKLFPDLPVQLVTAKTTKQFDDQPKLYIGTHALIRQLDKLQPALLLYDEQHRFGVRQRSYTPSAQATDLTPHVLTLSATPIPRSLMLTIFSHLGLSQIDQMPAGRIPVKTWVVPENKRAESFDWLLKEIQTSKNDPSQPHITAIVVCPFISQSKQEGFANIASATEKFAEITQLLKTQNKTNLKVALLHGKQKVTEKDRVTADLFAEKIDILVTTPVIEVGLDVPSASIIIIESADRFGMASLHQLRGRVGRAGQQAYCLCFSTNGKKNNRLKEFETIHNGLQLAELDLQRRGAGDLFSTQQHGFDTLRFAEWTNLELITQARLLFDEIQRKQGKFTSPIFRVEERDQEILGN